MLKRHTRASTFAVLAIAGAVALTGCSTAATTSAPSTSTPSSNGSKWDAVVKQANAEGSLTWYSAGTASVNQALVAAFNKEYPNISVNLTTLISGDLANRFASERSAGAPSADLIEISDTTIFTTQPTWFAKPTSDLVPNVAQYPADLKATGVQSEYVTTDALPFTITYNTNLIKKAPSTWADLIKAPWAGKGSVTDPRSSGSYMGTFAMLSKTYGDSYLQKLGSSGDTFFVSTPTQAGQVAAGASGYFAPTVAANSATLIQSGAPLKVVVPTPEIALSSMYAISTKAAHPAAARVFENFVMSREGQSSVCNANYQTFLYTDIPNCPAASAKLAVVDYALGVKDSANVIKLLGLK